MLNSRQACSLLVNTSLRYDCIPSHNWCYFFMQMTIVSVAVSASRHKHSYLPDTSVMCRWHDDDRIIDVQPKVICFCWEKQVSVALTMSTDHLFCSSPPPIPRKAWYTKFYEPARLSTPPKPLFSLNRWTPKPEVIVVFRQRWSTLPPHYACVLHMFSPKLGYPYHIWKL